MNRLLPEETASPASWAASGETTSPERALATSSGGTLGLFISPTRCIGGICGSFFFAGASAVAARGFIFYYLVASVLGRDPSRSFRSPLVNHESPAPQSGESGSPPHRRFACQVA